MKRVRHVSETAATLWLRAREISFSPHIYDYVEHGGTGESAAQLGVDERAVIKTLVMEDEAGAPLLVLMHGDCTVSTRSLARQIGSKRIEPCRPETAQRHSGYLVGGTSPFGIRKPLPVYFERSITQLDRIFINGGRRGFLVEIDPAVLATHLKGIAVDCAVKET